MIRFVTWNQGYNTRGFRAIDRGWHFVLDELMADVLLFQETVVPPWVNEKYGPSFLRAWPKRPWGSAILTSHGQDVLLADPDLRVLAVNTVVDGLGEVTLASLHARIIAHRVVPHLRRAIEALLPLLEGARFVVGGDLNTARAAERVWPAHGHAEFFEWLEGMGWHDCHWRMHAHEQTSVWSPRSQPLQADHVFTDPATATQVADVRFLDDPAIRELSDHGPLVVDVRRSAEEDAGRT